jgi:hypothetical protein
LPISFVISLYLIIIERIGKAFLDPKDKAADELISIWRAVFVAVDRDDMVRFNRCVRADRPGRSSGTTGRQTGTGEACPG